VSPPPLVRIRYRRPPDRLEIHEQYLVHDTSDLKVTFAPSVVRPGPLRIDGRTVLENGSPVVWFTFPGAWHDIGRFHTADGVFTGFYANILTPVELGPGHVWDTTDLFLDLWLDNSGVRVLDENDFDDAIARGWIDEATVRRARTEIERLRSAAQSGVWPAAAVNEWTLERARRRVEE
jgi:predicted RNA-binding protein associated with RNAse of E/G family